MGDDKPVTMERPQRGREMMSKKVPAGLAGDGRSATLMHEGYVGDTKFMVPDSNLDVMKQLVDLQFSKKHIPQKTLVGNQARTGRATISPDSQKDESIKGEILSTKKGKVGFSKLSTSDSESSSSSDSSTSITYDDTEVDIDESKSDSSLKSKIQSSEKESPPNTSSETSNSSKGLSENSTTKSNPSKGDFDSPARETERGHFSTTLSEASKGPSKTSTPSREANESVKPNKGSEPNTSRKMSTTSKSTSGTNKGLSKTARSKNKSEPSKSSRGSAKSVEDTGTAYGAKKDTKPIQGASHDSKKSFDNTGTAYGAKKYTKPLQVSSYESKKLRFLVSGHIKEHPSAKPIFIFHQYNGKSPFHYETPDFSQKKSEGDVKITIEGKFYKDSVLKEENNFPKSLNLKPEKITIDSRSKVWENEFNELIQVGDYNIRFNGQFLKTGKTGKYTPYLGIQVQNLAT